jgi:hypothetical protein
MATSSITGSRLARTGNVQFLLTATLSQSHAQISFTWLAPCKPNDKDERENQDRYNQENRGPTLASHSYPEPCLSSTPGTAANLTDQNGKNRRFRTAGEPQWLENVHKTSKAPGYDLTPVEAECSSARTARASRSRRS